MDKEKIYGFLTKTIPQEQIKIDEPMKKHTNFRIGGIADFYIIIKKVEEIKEVLQIAKANNIPYTILGNGSNILVGDKGIRGFTLKINIEKYEIKKEDKKAVIIVGAGQMLGKIAYNLQEQSIAGFEFAAGIPGTIGGAIYMNAGAHGLEMKDCIKTVTYLNEKGQLQEISNEECEFSYRHSTFNKKPFIIVEAKIELTYGNMQEIKNKIEEYKNIRKQKQPIGYPSAGSTFKRGENFITAKLIDECGLKGYCVGEAEVSTIHAGFVVNKGNATAKQVIEVINHVKNTVFEKRGEKIELEIELVGEF